ncbi:unnamed protein product [Citrullus colocynthis]|uniref:Uncharacterized protein n=1 Tax=Citrullus colocynthis TaxID=252529 RepID=A0ABP0Y9H5_9ROSI
MHCFSSTSRNDQRDSIMNNKIYIQKDGLISGIEDDSLKRSSSENFKQEMKIISSIFSRQSTVNFGELPSPQIFCIEVQKRRVPEQEADGDAIVACVGLSCFALVFSHWDIKGLTSIELLEGPKD